MMGLEERARRAGLPPLLLSYWAWTLLSTLASFLFTAGMIAILHNKFSYGILILWNDGFFWDLMVFAERFQHFRTASFWDAYYYPFSYPAAMGMVFAVLYRIPHLLRWYLLLCTAALTAWAWLVARAMARCSRISMAWAFALTFTIVATAWPAWLLLCSANTEGLVVIITAAGVWAFLRQRWWLAAMLLGTAGAMKIFPLVLLALLISRRRYRECLFGFAFAAALTLASLAILGPSLSQAQQHITAGLTFVKYTYALAVTQYAPDVSHSLFAPIKFSVVILYRLLHPGAWRQGQPAILETTFTIYMISASILGVLLYFLRIRLMPMLNQIFALTICSILLPPYSVDYTLLHLLLPLGLLLVYIAGCSDARVLSGLRACLICFVFLLPIETFFTLRYRFGSLIRSFALTALLVCVLRHPLPWRSLDEAQARLLEEPA